MTATAVTDARGAFRIVDLVPGDYVVTASLVGFRTTTAPATISARSETRLRTRPARSVPARRRRRRAPAVITEQRAFPSEQGRRGVGSRRTGVATGGGQVEGPRSFNTESYDQVDENGFKHVATDPLSTFSIDVDTASYANVRRFLRDGPAPRAGRGPHRGADQLLPATPTPRPTDGAPFSVTTEVAACPWNPAHRLARIGIQGRALASARAGRRATSCS